MTVQRRMPTRPDLEELARVLHRHQVEYAVIGGTAMMFHGFPRATKDIDLLLPLSHENNKKLRAALADLPFNQEALKKLDIESLDKGFSTAIEGDIAIDILFVANDMTFEQLREHLERRNFNGCEITTLDLDGLIKSKETTRDTDKIDVAKLRRLRIALQQSASERSPR